MHNTYYLICSSCHPRLREPEQPPPLSRVEGFQKAIHPIHDRSGAPPCPLFPPTSLPRSPQPQSPSVPASQSAGFAAPRSLVSRSPRTGSVLSSGRTRTAWPSHTRARRLEGYLESTWPRRPQDIIALATGRAIGGSQLTREQALVPRPSSCLVRAGKSRAESWPCYQVSAP